MWSFNFHDRVNKHDFVKTVPGKWWNICVSSKTSLVSLYRFHCIFVCVCMKYMSICFFDPIVGRLNSLAAGRFDWNFRLRIFMLILVVGDWDIFSAIALRRKSEGLTDDKSTLGQVMAWCRQAPSHYLSHCWARSMSPYGVTRPQWVNSLWPNGTIWHTAGLDAYFFPNLAVGQPSNNMDLSEIEIYLGIMIIVSFFCN